MTQKYSYAGDQAELWHGLIFRSINAVVIGTSGLIDDPWVNLELYTVCFSNSLVFPLVQITRGEVGRWGDCVALRLGDCNEGTLKTERKR